MGSKRPSCTLFGTSSSINTSDRKLHPGGNVSQDLSPRPAMTALSDRERDGGREDNWRREREAEKMRDKPRPKEVDPRDRYYDRERVPVPRPREADRGWSERGWREEDVHTRNGRPLSSVEKEAEREAIRGMRKGDTFPRIRKNSRERGRGPSAAGEMDDERGERRQRDRQRREEMDAREREREREWARQRDRERVRERDEVRGQRPKDERQNTGRRHAEDGNERERYQEFQDGRRDRGDTSDKRERDATRKRDKLRPDMGHREGRVPSPRRRRDWEEDERRRRREGRRDTRSEGDSDEREMRRDRERERQREELQYQQSKSEGDKRKSAQREREEEEDRRRHRERCRAREEDRTRRWEEEKSRDRAEPRPQPREADRDTREDWRRQQRYRDLHEVGRVRELKPGLEDPSSRGRQPAERAPMAPPRAQSSGEWSTTESDRDVEKQRGSGERRQREKKRSERAEREREERGERGEVAEGGRQEQRRMWLEPRWCENSREDDREGDDRERRVKSESGEETDRERQRARHEGHSDDQVRADQERGPDMDERAHLSSSDGGVEESDGEEAAGSGGGSELGWRGEGDRLLSGEEGFVTVSSGGDDEEHFQDCREFWDGSEEDQSKASKYVFCVIGQSLPRSATEDKSPTRGGRAGGAEIENPYDEVTWEPPQDSHGPLAPPPRRDHKCPAVNNRDSKSSGDVSDEDGEPRTITMGEEKENPYAEIGPINRDLQTEKLLTEWRQRDKGDGDRQSDIRPPSLPTNPYDDCFPGLDFEQIQPILDGINAGAMSPEEVEAIRIRLSGAWSISQEPKRHSQAPHLKWAKNVVREILGHSEDQQVSAQPQEEEKEVEEVGEVQEKASRDSRAQQEEIHREPGEPPVDEMRLDDELEMELKDLDVEEVEEIEEEEVEGSRGMGQKPAHMHAEQLTAMHGDTPTHTPLQIVTPGDARDEGQRGGDGEGPEGENGAMGEREGKEEREKMEEKEADTFLAVSNTLYKPSSCPILSCDTRSQLQTPPAEGGGQSTGESDDDRQEVESGEGATAEDEEEEDENENEEEKQEEEGQEGESCTARKQASGKMSLKSTCSFRDLGPKARLRRRGIRKTTERRKKRGSERVDLTEEEEGVGRDRRTRVFSTTDDEDDRSRSWGEVELRNVLDTAERRKRNSKFFNAAQLYQQYSEAAQNFEILRQARSDAVSLGGETAPSPSPSPPPARRPLPPLPASFHHQTPHSLSYTGSVTSVQSLPLPQPPRSEDRPVSPRLSVSLGQSSSLWRELPGVRNSSELEELSEDERRLQEVRFEVVTSEASYCRSLDIVVEHFVKSKQLGALLTTQDRNWLFSRLADVRAISHSFLSKLEERVESNIMSFTVCDIIARHCQRFRMVYVPYLTNQSYQDATYQRLMNENQGFKRIVEKLERSPVCQRLPFRSFLVLPFQRITRIKLLVQNIVKRTTPGTQEAINAIKALKLVEKLIQESNDSITQMKSIESLVSLSAKVDFECRTLPLISQSRRLVREGLVTELIDFSLKDTERNIYLHLFTDYLLLSLQKEGGRFTVIDHSPVSDLRVENCRVKLHSLQKNLFRLHMAHKALLLRTDTLSDKLRWISALSRPHSEIDFSAAQDFPQMQCVRSCVAQQPDELSLEKADIILVHQQSSDHWVEGTRLSDRQRGWVPESHLETISNSKVRNRNLSDAQKLTTATAAV